MSPEVDNKKSTNLKHLKMKCTEKYFDYGIDGSLLLQIPIDLRFNGKNKGIIASYCLLSKDYE